MGWRALLFFSIRKYLCTPASCARSISSGFSSSFQRRACVQSQTIGRAGIPRERGNTTRAHSQSCPYYCLVSFEWRERTALEFVLTTANLGKIAALPPHSFHSRCFSCGGGTRGLLSQLLFECVVLRLLKVTLESHTETRRLTFHFCLGNITCQGNCNRIES
jgi:hypothetical protein